ncbi:MAG: TlpA family protein disulfide reductase [Rhodobacteraceae bacterium]|nr:TlpA family protein disulfide reductase [Paracoccaceae bacterium]
MKTLLCAVLYTVVILSATPGTAMARDIALRAGDMRKLVFHENPQAVPDVPFWDESGQDITLDRYKGKVVLLNFWATWCAPCRHEMPALNALQQEIGSDAFQVVTIATGRNPPPAIARFFAKESINALPKYRDPKQALARGMAVFGLPMTVILNRDGQEIARLRGAAEWFTPEAINLMRAVIGAER